MASRNSELAEIRKRVEVINREVGEVVGELRTLKWLVGGTFLAAAGSFLLRLFGI
mgnify:CR=1 FL=1